MRQIVLDTETTGLDPRHGHRIIEVAGIEMVNRRLTGHHLHKYVNPEREIDAGAATVHGITLEFLADKPKFADIADEFLEFINGAELIIHNAPFDIGFLNAELARLDRVPVEDARTLAFDVDFEFISTPSTGEGVITDLVLDIEPDG